MKLTDFGIAQVVGLESMTITGTLVGSPAHMSPEQIEGTVELDYRADIWALGTVLYATATAGALPFEASTPHGILKRIVEGRYEDPRRINPHVDSALAGIIARCLQVDREARYKSVGEVAAELTKWLAIRELHEPEVELARWMAGREIYQAALSRQVIAAMLSVGATELSAGRRHAALEAYGRVLNLDPNHDEAMRRVRELTSGMRLRRALRVVAAFAGAALAVWGLWQLWPKPEPYVDPVMVSGRALAQLEIPIRAPRLEPNIPRAPRLRSGRQVGRVLGRLGPRIAKLTEQRTVVTVDLPDAPPDGGATGIPVRVSVQELALSVTIDDKPVTAGTTIRLTPGRHTALVTHPEVPGPPTVRRFVVEPNADGSPQKLHLSYAYAPAQIWIECQGGTVVADGKLLGPCGKAYSVPVDKSEPQKTAIYVKWDDERTDWHRDVTFRPGAIVRMHAE
ncbi:MAG: protein kinase [Myxococcota bacterium]